MIEDVVIYVDSEGRPWKRTTNEQGFYEKFSRIEHNEIELEPVRNRTSAFGYYGDEPLILGIEPDCKFYSPKGRPTKRKDWYP